MRLIINLVLVLLSFVLVWVLINSIREPIKFQAEKDKRENAVVERLMEIRQAQELYRSVTGNFANSFDSLNYILKTGKIATISVFGDPDDPSNANNITFDTTYSDAMIKVNEFGINLDSLPYVPYGKGVIFEIQADTITYQSTLVNVVEVGIERSKFMGPWADPRFARYDSSYKPGKKIKFGNMTAPNLAGNWER